MSGAATPALDVRSVSMDFGGVRALHDVTFEVGLKETCALVGPNGAGKTTLFNCVCGIYSPSAGAISVHGQDIGRRAVHDIASLGIGRTYQNLALFESLTVFENVLVGAHRMPRPGLLSTMFWLPRTARAEREAAARAMETLDRVGLMDHAESAVGSLPFGTLKRVELARALASNPSMLMLDEPANGLRLSEVEELAGHLREIHRAFDLTLLVIEHNMRMVRLLADHVVVLDGGSKLADGTFDEVSRSEQVISAYLGSAAHG